MHQHINRPRATGTVLDSASTRTLRRFSPVPPAARGRRRPRSSAPAAAATASGEWESSHVVSGDAVRQSPGSTPFGEEHAVAAAASVGLGVP